MGSLARDLGWCHAGQTHESLLNTHTRAHAHNAMQICGRARRLHTNWIDSVKLDNALGLIMNSRTAKYLTPRLLVEAANALKPTDTNTHKHTQQQLTHAASLESGALILKHI